MTTSVIKEPVNASSWAQNNPGWLVRRYFKRLAGRNRGRKIKSLRTHRKHLIKEPYYV